MNRSGMVYKFARVFKALSSPTRLRIIRMLASNTEERLGVSDLAEQLGISQPAASQHLKYLKDVDILYSKRDGTSIHYYIDLEELKRIKLGIDAMFEMAFMRCDVEGDCEQCPFKDTCEASRAKKSQ